MKYILIVFALAFGLTSSIRADIVSHTLDIENFGRGSGSANIPILVASVDFSLPDIDSLDAVGIQLAHEYGSDVTLELIAPGGGVFMIVEGQGRGNSPHQGGFDADQLGDGVGFALANIVDYSIVQNGSTGTDWLDNGDPLPTGIYDQRLVGSESWATGGYLAGDWTLNLYDSMKSANIGSVGDVSLSYTPTAVPEPSALAISGLIWIAMLTVPRRRRFPIPGN